MASTGGSFSNVGRNLAQIARSPVTWAWVALILGIEVLVMAVGGHNRQPAWSWFEALGLTREGVLAGKVWQVITYGFLHGSWWHVAANALLLLLVGSRIEHMAGRMVLVKVIIFGVLGGAVGHLVLAPGGKGAPLLIGFSGACIGLLLLLTTLSPQSRMVPLPISGKSLGLGILVTELILALADPALGVPGFAETGQWINRRGWGGWSQMGHACHFGGGVAGWLFGRWLLRPRISLERLRRDRERREAKESSLTE
jgi:membrane associated rhomboid family serine protease